MNYCKTDFNKRRKKYEIQKTNTKEKNKYGAYVNTEYTSQCNDNVQR